MRIYRKKKSNEATSTNGYFIHYITCALLHNMAEDACNYHVIIQTSGYSPKQTASWSQHTLNLKSLCVFLILVSHWHAVFVDPSIKFMPWVQFALHRIKNKTIVHVSAPEKLQTALLFFSSLNRN